MPTMAPSATPATPTPIPTEAAVERPLLEEEDCDEEDVEVLLLLPLEEEGEELSPSCWAEPVSEVEVVPVLGASLGCGLREKGQADTLCHRFENLECDSSVELAKDPSCGVADASLPSCGDVPSGAASGSGSGSGSTGVSPSLSLNCISSLSFKLRTLLRSQSVTLNCSKKPLSVRSHQQRSSMGTSFGFMSSGRFGNMEASASA